MSVNPSALAAAIASAIGQASVTTQVSGFAQGILEELTQNGVASVGLPSGNTISGMSGSSMASKVAAHGGYGSVSTELLHFCTGIVSHIQSAANVAYTGPTPPASPIYFLGGTVSGLSGSAMASTVAADVGYPSVSSQLSGMCGAITSHIMANAQITNGIIS